MFRGLNRPGSTPRGASEAPQVWFKRVCEGLGQAPREALPEPSASPSQQPLPRRQTASEKLLERFRDSFPSTSRAFAEPFTEPFKGCSAPKFTASCACAHEGCTICTVTGGSEARLAARRTALSKHAHGVYFKSAGAPSHTQCGDAGGGPYSRRHQSRVSTGGQMNPQALAAGRSIAVVTRWRTRPLPSWSPSTRCVLLRAVVQPRTCTPCGGGGGGGSGHVVYAMRTPCSSSATTAAMRTPCGGGGSSGLVVYAMRTPCTSATTATMRTQCGGGGGGSGRLPVGR